MSKEPREFFVDLFDCILEASDTSMTSLLKGLRHPVNDDERRWLAYHKKTPVVFDMFNGFTQELVRRGYTHHSARAIIFRIRWETMKPHDDVNPSTGEVLKISDHHSPYYGRLWMEQNPSHAKFFRTKKIKGEVNDKYTQQFRDQFSE